MVFSNNLLFGAAAAATATSGFDPTLIGNSVWLDGSADFLSAELGAKTRTKAVIGTWIQKTGFTTPDATIFSKKGTAHFAMRMQDQASKAGKISIFDYDGSNFQYNAESTSLLLRDSGWYHIMISIDTTATAGNRLRYYINGIDQTSTLTVTTDYTASDNPSITGGSGEPTQWGVGPGGASQFNPCYLAQSFMLDDDSIQNGDVAVTDILDSFTFGTNGSQFVPKADADIATLASSAGGDSFCLDFANSSDLGNDISSNNNDFTPTSMAAANQSSNTPSLVYPLLNPLSAAFSTTLSNGNTTASGSTGNGDDINPGIIIPKTGKWVWQITNTTDADLIYGVRNFSDMKAGDYSYTNLYGFYSHTGDLVQGASPSGSYLDAASGGDVYQIYYNAETRKMWVSDNGTIPNSGDPDAGSNEAFTIPDSGFDLCPTALVGGTAPNSTFDFGLSGVTLHANGQSFKPLTSANLPAPTYQGIDYFKPVLYTGNGTAIGSGGKAVTSVGFQPDEVWIKNRDATDDHALYDIVRGVTKQLESNTATAESTESEGLTTFGSDGFTVGSLAQVNTNTENYVSWNWLGSNSTSTTSPAGSIASTSTAADAGHFSVGTYTGQTAAGTVGHGLGGVAEMVIVWDMGFANSIAVYHAGVASDAATDYLLLNQTDAATDNATFWNDTAPTSSVFSVGTGNNTNGNTRPKSFLAFRSVAGVCKVGSYTGNSSDDGPYLSLGFKPAWWMVKETTVSDASHDWFVADSARYTFNGTTTAGGLNGGTLEANDSTAEKAHNTNFADNPAFDFLADGIKLRSNSGTINGTGRTYIYLAMADIGGNGTLPPVYGR